MFVKRTHWCVRFDSEILGTLTGPCFTTTIWSWTTEAAECLSLSNRTQQGIPALNTHTHMKQDLTAVARAVQRDCQWGLKTVGIHTGHMSLEYNKAPGNHKLYLDQPITTGWCDWKPCLKPHWQSCCHQASTVYQSNICDRKLMCLDSQPMTSKFADIYMPHHASVCINETTRGRPFYVVLMDFRNLQPNLKVMIYVKPWQ